MEYLQTQVSTEVILKTDELDNKSGKETSEMLREIKSQSGIEITQLIGLDGMLRLQKYVEKDEKFIVENRSN